MEKPVLCDTRHSQNIVIVFFMWKYTNAYSKCIQFLKTGFYVLFALFLLFGLPDALVPLLGLVAAPISYLQKGKEKYEGKIWKIIGRKHNQFCVHFPQYTPATTPRYARVQVPLLNNHVRFSPFVGCFSKLPQIYLNQKNKNTGNLSFLTYVFVFFGNLARLFTIFFNSNSKIFLVLI
ncbi:conserved Plasmodium protein, unknown function [Plasmodium ovale wallikeri]|uniref:Uncharacterized protein n=1 Tax=Plasmodium ovale wallikeri TaxID=864142 RepID=A0A1A8YVA9_PLAOA|nr:conserved Plasmodium protein, unknown function [Plasmodium ovale wallikeri]SBT36064.1 conserved Plasmodium protein, unknown function [Plasmodium ovale wallikeri]